MGILPYFILHVPFGCSPSFLGNRRSCNCPHTHTQGNKKLLRHSFKTESSPKPVAGATSCLGRARTWRVRCGSPWCGSAPGGDHPERSQDDRPRVQASWVSRVAGVPNCGVDLTPLRMQAAVGVYISRKEAITSSYVHISHRPGQKAPLVAR